MESIFEKLNREIAGLDGRQKEIVTERAVLDKEAQMISEYRFVLSDILGNITDIQRDSEIQALSELCAGLDITYRDILDSSMPVKEIVALLTNRVNEKDKS